MSFAYDFIGVGGVAYDLALTVDRLPLADGKYPAQLIGHLPGGFIANATCAAARLGLATAYAGWVGDDAPGDMLRQDFVDWGVTPAGLIHEPDTATPFAVVITDTHGQRCILLPASPLYHIDLTPDQLALAAQARVIYTFPRDRAWCDSLAARAEQSGGALVLDIEFPGAMQRADLEHAMHQAGIVFVSRETLQVVGGDALHHVQRRDPAQWLIMTDGARGAYGITGGMDEAVFCPAQTVANVVDTTGAGDTFHAALIAAKLRGADLPEALAFATAAAAIKVQHRGARGGLPTAAEVAARRSTQP